MHRYFIFCWNADNRQCTARVEQLELALLAAPETWAVAFRATGVLVAHRPSGRETADLHLLADGRGLVLGSLFHRECQVGGRPSDVNFGEPETDRIVISCGRHLVRHYWGSYIAIIYDSKARSFGLLRDPTANLPCYRANWSGVHVFFSDMADLKHFIPISLSVNWNHLAARLLCGNRLSRECSVHEIEDIPGGEYLTPSGEGFTHLTLWHPAQFCIEDGLQDEARALDELQHTVLNVVHALASRHSDVIIKLSGGLDSSIVASCLARYANGPKVTCVNFYISNEHNDVSNASLPAGLDKDTLRKVRRIIGSADERPQARNVARQCGFRLVEREKRLEDFDVRRISEAPLAPRPSNYAYVLDEDEVERDLAIDCGATACFTGEAGDTVFYNTQRVLAPLDHAYLHPFGSEIFRHITHAATLSGESIPRIIAKVIRHGVLRTNLPYPYDPMQRPNLLTDDIKATVPPGYFRHPWETPGSSLCPGKQSHVAGVAQSALFYPYAFHRDRVAPSVHPLASQPVVETCLRIPTYVLLLDGVSRGLARRAFRNLLPTDVIRRTAKGSPMAFWQRAVRQNVRLVRDLLCSGTLVREHVLDRRKLEAYLADDQPFLTVQADQIIDYLGCEAWVNQVNCT